MDKSTVSRIITKVTNAICHLRNRFISFPRRRAELLETKQSFYQVARFPNIIGMFFMYIVLFKKMPIFIFSIVSTVAVDKMNCHNNAFKL